MSSNKVMLITGATSGIGKSLAEYYYKKKYKLILTGSSEKKIQHLKKKFRENSLIICIDLTNPKEVKLLINKAISHFKKIDILIANAGLYEPAKIISGDPERFDKVINLNISSVFRIVNLLLPHMKKNNFGDIAITSSISGHQAIYWEPVYSATKHAIQSFAHGLRTQVAKYNIRVISIAPGIVLTELWGINPKLDKQKIKHMTNKGTALKTQDVVDCFEFALNRKRGVTIRDLVILPTNQNI